MSNIVMDTCWECDGTGVVLAASPLEGMICGRCHGTGVVEIDLDEDETDGDDD